MKFQETIAAGLSSTPDFAAASRGKNLYFVMLIGLRVRVCGSEFETILALLVLNSELVDAPDYLRDQICDDREDDKFLACALAAGVSLIISGDAALLRVTGWNGIEVIKPREVLNRLER